MNKLPIVTGRGGKSGGQARVAVEAPDSLRSKSYARILDLISEGPIEGFVNANGKIVRDGEFLSVTVVAGVITAAVLMPGSAGYPNTPTTAIISDLTGTGAVIKVSASGADGELDSVSIESGGSGYSDTPVVRIPSVLGQAILLDGNPLQNTDLTYNFEDVSVYARTGEQSQTPIPGFETTQRVLYAEGVEVTEGSDFNLLISDPTVDEITVGIRVPSLYQQDVTNGDVSGTSVTYRVWIKYRTDPEKFLYFDVITGKSSGEYLRTRQADLSAMKDPAVEDHYWMLRVERVSPDSTQASLQNKTFISFVTGITNTPLSYPNCALIGLELNAEQFGSVPTRGYRTRLLQVQVPTNYFPETRTYNRDRISGLAVTAGEGIPIEQPWDGTFYTAWSDNPAWCLYALCSSTRYGLGQYLGTRGVDKWMLYQIARYSDELVPNGYGGTEPRFTCNVYVQTKEQAYKLLTDFLSVFRGMMYWSQGSIAVYQDAPAGAVALFTNANVKDGLFTYSGSSRKARHTVAYVRYNDPNDQYRAKNEYVEDLNGILRNGIREIEIAAFACSSRGQAHRLGKWYLLSEREETETVTFRTGMEGIVARPGQIIDVNDNNRSGVMFGGRITKISVDRNLIYTDRTKADFDARLVEYATRVTGGVVPVTFDASVFVPRALKDTSEFTSSEEIQEQPLTQTFRLFMVMADEEGTLVLKLAEGQAFPADVEPGFVWGISSNVLVSQQFRLLGIEEVSPFEFELTGIEYHSGKYDAVEKDIEFETLPISVLPDGYLYPQTPQNLTATLETIYNGQTPVRRISLSWSPPRYSFVSGYYIEMRKGQGNFHYKTSTSSTQAEIDVTLSDTYTFKVYSLGYSGARSAPAQVSIFVPVIGGGTNDTIDLTEKITGLELFNQGNLTTFQGRDAVFDWRLNSLTNSYEIGSEPAGGNSGGNSLDFSHYEIKIYAIRQPLSIEEGEPLIRQTITKTSSYAFRWEENRETVGGPHREFIFEVLARDVGNNISIPVRLRVQNPHPTVPVVTVDILQADKLVIQFPASGNPDFAGYRVWLSTDPELDPTTERPVYEGNANPLTLIVETGTVYYYCYAEYDVFSDWSEYANFTAEELALAISEVATFTAA